MQNTKIVFLLFPRTHLLDLAGPAQVFYEANQLGNAGFTVQFAAAGETTRTEQGLGLTDTVRPENLSLQAGDFICIAGFDFAGFVRGELDESINSLAGWLRKQWENGVYLGSICSGALALAKAGLLQNVQCTSHWKCLSYMRKNHPEAQVLDNRLYVMDKRIFTSAGMTTGIDMALALVDKWRSPLLAARVAQEMVIDIRRAETGKQQHTFLDFDNHFNAEVYKMQEILANHLEARFTLEGLARMLNLSKRHLTRLFRQHTGQTIQDYRNALRIRHGEVLLCNTEMFVKEIAAACGFDSVRQFERLWKKHRQVSPEAYRKLHRQ